MSKEELEYRKIALRTRLEALSERAFTLMFTFKDACCLRDELQALEEEAGRLVDYYFNQEKQ